MKVGRKLVLLILSGMVGFCMSNCDPGGGGDTGPGCPDVNGGPDPDTTAVPDALPDLPLPDLSQPDLPLPDQGFDWTSPDLTVDIPAPDLAPDTTGSLGPCDECITDADCSPGLVCADASAFIDDPLVPNICTIPCPANSVCPPGMACNLPVTLFCTCDLPCQDLVVLSDTTSTVDGTGTFAVEVTPTSSAWNPATTGIPGAKWIWVTNPAQNPVTETHTFTKTFTWNHPVGAAVLRIASDNGYSVAINGVTIDQTGNSLVDPTPTGTTFSSPVTYHVANAIVPGTNTLVVSVTNNGMAHAFNPAGLRYKLKIFCQPPNPCKVCDTNADCLAGLSCQDDDGLPATPTVCTAACGSFPTATGCADGQTCDADTGLCRCDRCGDVFNPTCVPTDCETDDGLLGSCHPTADGCLCLPPNYCVECTTDADCTGGLVCADAYNTWDDPATPNICTVPCAGAGICPDGMFCDFNVSKYCKCDPCIAPPPQMVAWWPLDETVGNTAVELDNGADGTWMGSPVPVPGMVAGALDTSAGYVQIPNASLPNPGTSNFTVDAWVNYQANPPQAFCQDTVLQFGGFQFGILWWNDEFEVRLPPSFHQHVPFAGGPNQWHLVALTLDRSDPLGIKLYMDGVLAGAYSPAGIGSLSTTADMLLGIDSLLGCPFFGALDEVELFGRALSHQEILDLYQAGEAGKCKWDTCTPDVTPPVISCPPPVSMEANWPECKAKPLPASALDNCDPTPDITVWPTGFAGSGVFLITYTAMDDSGNSATCQTEVHVYCDECTNPANDQCEPKMCKLPDGTAGKCQEGPTGCGCQPFPANPCAKCDSDATCTGGLVCQDDDGSAATPKVCTTPYVPATGCPSGMHGDFGISKFCICDDCSDIFNPKCDSVECVISKGVVGKCKVGAAGCDCAQ